MTTERDDTSWYPYVFPVWHHSISRCVPTSSWSLVEISWQHQVALLTGAGHAKPEREQQLEHVVKGALNTDIVQTSFRLLRILGSFSFTIPTLMFSCSFLLLLCLFRLFFLCKQLIRCSLLPPFLWFLCHSCPPFFF